MVDYVLRKEFILQKILLPPEQNSFLMFIKNSNLKEIGVFCFVSISFSSSFHQHFCVAVLINHFKKKRKRIYKSTNLAD